MKDMQMHTESLCLTHQHMHAQQEVIIRAAQLRNHQLESELIALTSTNASLNGQVAALTSEAATTADRITDLSAAHASTMALLAEVQQKYAFSTDCAERLAIQLDDQIMAYEEKLTAAEAARQKLEANLRAQERALQDAVNASMIKEAAVNSLLSTKEAELREHMQTLLTLQQDLQRHINDEVVSEEQRVQLAADRSALQAKLTACELDLAAVNAQRATLERSVSSLEEELQTTKAEAQRELAALKSEYMRQLEHAETQGQEKVMQLQKVADASHELLSLQVQTLCASHGMLQKELESQIIELHWSIEQYQNEKNELHQQLVQAQTHLQETTAALKRLQEEYSADTEEAQQRHASLCAQLQNAQERFQTEVGELQRKCDEQRTRQKEQQAITFQQLMNSTVAKRDLAASYRKLQQQVEEDKGTWQQTQTEWRAKEGSLASKTASLELELQKMTVKQRSLTSSLAQEQTSHTAHAQQCASQLAVLQHQIAQSETQLAGARQELAHVRDEGQAVATAHALRENDLQQQLATVHAQLQHISSQAARERHQLTCAIEAQQVETDSLQRRCTELQATFEERQQSQDAHMALLMSEHAQLQQQYHHQMDESLTAKNRAQDHIVSLEQVVSQRQVEAETFREQRDELCRQLACTEQAEQQARDDIAAKYESAMEQHRMLIAEATQKMRTEHDTAIGRLTADIQSSKVTMGQLQREYKQSRQQAESNKTTLQAALNEKEKELIIARKQCAVAATQLTKLNSLLSLAVESSAGTGAQTRSSTAAAASTITSDASASASPVPSTPTCSTPHPPQAAAAVKSLLSLMDTPAPVKIERRDEVACMSAPAAGADETPVKSAMAVPATPGPSFEENLDNLSLEYRINLVRQKIEQMKTAPSIPDRLSMIWFQHIGVKPKWQADDNQSDCTICQTSFGWFTRRHHCRSCGFIFCNDCSLKRMPIAHMQNQEERCCDICAVKIRFDAAVKK
jgi:chromosome segregation ATPase